LQCIIIIIIIIIIIASLLLLLKQNNFGLSDRCINWFQCYLSSRFSVVRALGNSSSPFPMLSGVPQGSTLGPLLLSSFIIELCAKIHFFSELPLYDDLKIFRVI
jgi:hypothetical protein